jgi:hypothetical protein
MLKAIKALPHFLCHDIFMRGCMLELRDVFEKYDSELKMALRSLVILCSRYDCKKAKYTLGCYVKYRLGIPMGCADNEFTEYLPVLDYLIYNTSDAYVFSELVEKAAGATVASILDMCDIVNDYYDGVGWDRYIVNRYSCKEAVVRDIITIITVEANHPADVTSATHVEEGDRDFVYISGLIGYLYDELKIGDGCGPEFPQYRYFLRYLSEAIWKKGQYVYGVDGEMGHYTDEYYNFDDMMSTLQAATIDDLVNVLILILAYKPHEEN